ncbi:helix-turn-helix transcriptional regulator [Buttiauxella sp. B2]|uniref:helix-turn-helix domain-containing protein n=1 Tax=Buttiauxella sp. B2 TaxID=2587812 RepID=UPI001674F883|nr:helix-turn-helix transcriptional regulator [Buttiauxella sp. B2]
MIYVYSDDVYFSLGLQHILLEAGMDVVLATTGYDFENGSVSYSTQPGLLIVDSHNLSSMQRIVESAMDNGINVIYVEEGGLSLKEECLWPYGILPKKTPVNTLPFIISNLRRARVCWYKHLTVREMSVMNELVKGTSSKDVSKNLCISVKTVSGHKFNALKKMGLTRMNAQAVYIYGKYKILFQHTSLRAEISMR